MDQKQLEQLIQAITEEIASYLGGAKPSGAGFCGLDIDELVCPGCDQSCAEKCERKTRAVIGAGADRISASPGTCNIHPEIARLIDHTLLKPEATRGDVTKLCEEARRFCFASVCINPWNVALAAELLRGSNVKVCTVVGFPLGATLPCVKVRETEEVIKLGAQEIDMVINVGALKSHQDELVETDIRGVVDACHRGGAICKVILETALLSADEKVRGSLICKNAGADFVKTSTGFSSGGATAEDVALMRAAVGRDLGVKAAGGVRTLEDLKKMVQAGATRIGASASVRIMEEAQKGDAPVPPPAAPPAPSASSAY